jgi:hypothetical protein
MFDVANCDLKRAGGFGAMIGRGIRTAVVALTLIGGGPVAHGQPEVCSDWQVRKLDSEPAWYSAAIIERDSLSRTWLQQFRRLGKSDSLLSKYTVRESFSLLQIEWGSRPLDTLYDWEQISPAVLYICGEDTVRLDSSECGFGTPSVDRGGHYFVTEHSDCGPEYPTSTIVVYDLSSRERNVVQEEVCGSSPLFAPSSFRENALAFSDYSDVLLYYPETKRRELAFRGDPPQPDYCSYPCVSDLFWAPDGSVLVFRYLPSGDTETPELREIRWMPQGDSTKDSSN